MRFRRLGPLGLLVLGTIIVGVAGSLVSGDPVFALVKESFVTAALAAAFLGSLAAPRPLIFVLGRHFATGNDPAQVARWEARWQLPAFRAVMRRMTMVWGFGYLLDAGARAIIAVYLAPQIAVVASPLLAVGVTIALILWTSWYARLAAR